MFSNEKSRKIVFRQKRGPNHCSTENVKKMFFSRKKSAYGIRRDRNASRSERRPRHRPCWPQPRHRRPRRRAAVRRPSAAAGGPNDCARSLRVAVSGLHDGVHVTDDDGVGAGLDHVHQIVLEDNADRTGDRPHLQVLHLGVHSGVRGGVHHARPPTFSCTRIS